MAIDSENKRRSVLGVRGWWRILPVPDGQITSPDRSHLWQYSGIPIGLAAAAADIIEYPMSIRQVIQAQVTLLQIVEYPMAIRQAINATMER